MALSKIDVANMLTGVTPVANGGTALSSGFKNSVERPNDKPLIINGNMNVWQRSTSTVTMSDGYYNVDRFRGEENTAGSATWSRSTSVPDDTDFPFSLQVDCTGTDTSLASSDKCVLQHTIEAQNIAKHTKWGTSNAEKLTLSFWVKSNQTGQHSVGLRKLDNTNYNQPKTYTISSADTWEQKILVFSALTSTGGAITEDNGDGLQIFWGLTTGSGYQGTADTWTQTNEGAIAVSGDVNFLSSTDNNFYLTGVQLEIGEYTSSTLPAFEHESFADNLARCQRYYQKPVYSKDYQGTTEEYGAFNTGTYSADAYFRVARPLGVEMRTNPTLSSSSGTNYFFILSGANDDINDVTLHNDSNFKTVWVYNNDEASSTAGQAGILMANNTSAYIAFDAEL